MSKVGIFYWSSTGNTLEMANALADHVRNNGGEADVFSVTSVDPSKVDEYDSVAFGCSAMGAEQLDEVEFEPFFLATLPSLSQKKVALFGSYGWGDGEWMRTWESTLLENGISVCTPSVIANGAPDVTAIEELNQASKALI